MNIPQFPESYWLKSAKLPHFDSLKESIKTDVVIIGGGITGITTAYLLSKQKIDVTLIEASTIVNGTTGHTTAKITAQHGLIYDELIQHFGLEKASLYYQAAIDAKKLIEDNIEDLNIQCDYQKQDAYIFTNEDSYISKLEKEKQAYEKIEISSELTDTIPLHLPIKSALMMKDQAQFHPLKYLSKLVEESSKNGVHIFEHTTAMDIEYNERPTVITRDGYRIEAKNVVIASHFPFYNFEGFYFSRMYPERSYVIAMKSKDSFPGGMYINAESPTRSIRSTQFNGEDLWLIGGENHKTGQGISTITHYEALKEYALNQFNVEEFSYRWSAQDLTTLDKLPYIGSLTDNERKIFVATGYRKWGMTNGTIAAKIIADKILDKENQYESLYTPSRFQADPALKKFISFNTDVAKHLIKGKLEYTDNNIEKLKEDEATITRIDGQRTGVYRDKNKKLYLVDTTCTHMGCEVEWNSGDRTWDCPCHGSRFSIEGEVIEGPAKKPLARREIK